ncbi:Spy/CpxP family protein refolding chaperone [Legionella maioricensis]|uniref:Spy/CpxP family protein refolding chaperone n=1 Tax=Legionella maioricensis TaxID=2896528 RepID=A0A9X2IAG2_9GAMM|nr:Spy/CpxP family protein refolding chaperone [Legionella maioricensis]MCL9683615.1 Spy/CpxP family protein refolding chaperone [Legionella maioricensis]MCL9687637.1 Spy/CpxP family protein refolding chaperone [Legionella maioricensis]
MDKKFLWIVALAFSFILSQTAAADSWGCRKGMEEMVGSLKLDNAQKTKIKPVLEQLKAQMKDNGSQMKDVDIQINQQADSATMDQATIDSLVDKKTKLIGNMIKAKIVAKNQIFAILNTKQKAELNMMMKKIDSQMAAQFKNCHQEN